MTVNVSNTNLNDNFDSWRLNTNLLATTMSNNVVTVSRAGSANRGGAAKGNGHVSGTFSATNLRTSTLKGGNTTTDSALTVASNTTISGTSLTVSANAEFTGNVNFTTSGTDRLIMGDVSRIRMTGGTRGQFLRVATQTDALDFATLSLRDIDDLSTNSAHIIMSGANSSFGQSLDSTHLVFTGGTGTVDAARVFLAGDATVGDSDLYVKLVDDAGDSALVIADSANTAMVTIDSDGEVTAKKVTVQDEINVATASGKGLASSLIPKTDSSYNLGSSARKYGTVWADTTKGGTGSFTNLGASGTFTANGNATFNGTTVTVTNNLVVQGSTTISSGQAFTADDGTFSTLTATGLTTLQGNVAFSAGTSKIAYGSTTIIGKNNKLHANNTITDGTLTSGMLANTMTNGAAAGGSTSVPVITVNDKGQVTGISNTTMRGVEGLAFQSSNSVLELSASGSTVYKAPIPTATTSAKGLASFHADDFDVSSGEVTLGDHANGAVLAISGTTNEVNVSRTNGTVTVGLPDDVTITGQLNVGENIVITGNLVVQGSTTTVNTEEVNLADNIIKLNSNHTGAPTQDAGFTVERGTSTDVSFLWDETNDRWTLGSQNIYTTGEFLGNATTATTLETTRTIAGKNFNGSQNVTLSTVTPGNYLSGSSYNGSTNRTFDVEAYSTNTANTIVLRDASGNFSAGTITATLAGNANTATRWATSRTLSLYGDLSGSVSFNGSASMNLTASIRAGMVGTTELATNAVTKSKMGDDAVGSAELVSAVRLRVLNSAGTVLKDLYGAGS